MVNRIRKTTCSIFIFNKGRVFIKDIDKYGSETINEYPDFWGAVALKNVSEEPQSTKLLIRDFESGKLIKTIAIVLDANAGKLITYLELPELINKMVSLELDFLGSKNIILTPMVARGNSQIVPLKVDTRDVELLKKG